jgi:hypothetical protein
MFRDIQKAGGEFCGTKSKIPFTGHTLRGSISRGFLTLDYSPKTPEFIAYFRDSAVGNAGSRPLEFNRKIGV